MSETTHDPPPMLLPFVLQMLGVALAGSVLDGGYFAACYIVASGMFWIWAFRYFGRRSHSNRAAVYFFRWGPMILFWVMFFCAEPVYRLFHH